MRRLATALLIASLALVGAVASVRSQPHSFNGSAFVGIEGWGSVKAVGGAIGHPTARCTKTSCGAVNFLLKRPRVVLTAKPYKGWKFVGWRRACKSTKRPRCVLDASHARKNIFGGHTVRAVARFVPVAVGLTRGNPIPLGTAANVGNGFVMRVNSANANVQLETSPPAGTEYFDVSLTATNTSGRLRGWIFGFDAQGSHARYPDADASGCSASGPQPLLDTLDPFAPGESRTGYVCWTIAASDASGLELFFGSGTLDPPRTTWFALH